MLRDGMIEDQLVGVEHQPFRRPSAINFVAEDRATDRGEMNADLMLAARLNENAQQIGPEDADLRNRELCSGETLLERGSPEIRIFTEIRSDFKRCELRDGWHDVNAGKVLFDQLVPIRLQSVSDGGGFRKEQHAAGFAVEAMDDERSNLNLCCESRECRFDLLRFGGNTQQALRFINRNEVLVFVEDCQGSRWLRCDDPNAIAFFNSAIVASDDFAVHLHATGRQEFLRPGPIHLRK